MGRDVVQEQHELARRHGVEEEREAVLVQEVMVEIPSVEHEDVEDGDGTHVVYGRLSLEVSEGGAAENGEGEQIESSADDHEKQWIVSNDYGWQG